MIGCYACPKGSTSVRGLNNPCTPCPTGSTNNGTGSPACDGEPSRGGHAGSRPQPPACTRASARALF